MPTPRELDPFERWMVRSNLETIKSGEDPERLIAILRANGYIRVADAVAEKVKEGNR